MDRTARDKQFASRTDSGQESRYVRHRPEWMLLYPLVAQYYPTFVKQLVRRDQSLPDYVHREFDAYLRCDQPENGFLHMRCESCHAERLVAFNCKKRGFYSGHPTPRPFGVSLRLFKIAPGDFVPELRRPADGRECSIAGGRCSARQTHALVGIEFSLSTQIPVRPTTSGIDPDMS